MQPSGVLPPPDQCLLCHLSQGSLKQGCLWAQGPKARTGSDGKPQATHSRSQPGMHDALGKDFQKALHRQTYRMTISRKETFSWSIPLCQKLATCSYCVRGSLNPHNESHFTDESENQSIWSHARGSQREPEGMCACQADAEPTTPTAAVRHVRLQTILSAHCSEH